MKSKKTPCIYTTDYEIRCKKAHEKQAMFLYETLCELSYVVSASFEKKFDLFPQNVAVILCLQEDDPQKIKVINQRFNTVYTLSVNQFLRKVEVENEPLSIH